MKKRQGVKCIPESERNPLFLLPLDERIKLVDEVLTKIQENAIDIRFFETEEYIYEQSGEVNHDNDQ